jgi:hypothetical protein
MLAPTIDSDKTDAQGHCPWCEDEAALRLSSLGVAAPQAMESPIATDHHGVLFSLNTRCAWAGGTCVNYPDFFLFENHQFHIIYCVTLA